MANGPRHGPRPEELLPDQELGTRVTYLTFATGFGGGEGVTPAYLASIGFPIREIRSELDASTGDTELVGRFEHSAYDQWYDKLPLYRSNMGTSLIAPLWGSVSDVFVIHFIILYTLSIIVRYLPSVWYQIEHGSLDHVRALLEHYITIVDTVIPKCGIERITGNELNLIYPGSLRSPI